MDLVRNNKFKISKSFKKVQKVSYGMENIRKNVLLKNFTTFKLGGKAKYFIRVKNIQELINSIKWSKIEKIPFFILGGGSNILFSDKGFNGLIIKNEIKGIEFKEKDRNVFVTSMSGEDWDSFVENVVNRKLYGLENLSGIPGTVGAAPIQNIGAYGTEVKDTIYSVETLNSKTLKTEKFTNKDCLFGYRNSFFKTKKGKNFIILNVTFKLPRNNVLNTKYRDVNNYFAGKDLKLNLKNVRGAILEIRSKKFPDLSKIGCAGSFFKNPIISKIKLTNLLKKYPNIPYFATNNGKYKVSLAFILDKVINYKGLKIGNIGVFKRQPLVLVNFGNGNMKEIKKLRDEIKNNVYKKTNIKIEEEVLFIN